MRRAIRYILFSLLVLVGRQSSAQKGCGYRIDTANILADQNLKHIVNKIAADNFKEYNSVSKLPKAVLGQLICLTNGFSIADKNQPFQADCSPDHSLPLRQLDYLAIGKTSIILTYWTGGDGVAMNILLIEYSTKGIKQLWKTSSLDGLTEPKDVMEKYSNGTLSFQTGIFSL